MQRDWNLIRAILTQASEKYPGVMLSGTEVQGWDHLIVNGHIRMLSEAGYVHAALNRGDAIVLSAMVKDITMKGYDLSTPSRAKAFGSASRRCRRRRESSSPSNR
jgi:hypothetical protein